MFKLLLLFVLTFNVSLAVSEENRAECAQCEERKSEMCTEECLLVGERKQECIEACTKEYCKHKCGK